MTACLSLAAATAQAQMTIVEADFETTFPGFGYAYDYSGFGDASCSVNTDSSAQTNSSYDVATSPAATGTMDTSAWAIPGDSCYNYAGWGLGIGFVFFDKVLSSGDLSDYTVKFDASATGYDPGDDGLNTELKVLFQAEDDDDPDTGAESYALFVNGGNLGGLPALPLLTTTPQTFTINLGDLNLPTAFDYDFTTDFAQTFIVMLELAPNTNAGELGIDADNVISVDNIQFEGPFTAPLIGDFDGNARVDGHDFIVWQRGESPNGILSNDLADWQANYGMPGGGAATAAVPEPAGMLLLGCAVLGMRCWPMRGRGHRVAA
jgi:hypothetical protein